MNIYDFKEIIFQKDRYRIIRVPTFYDERTLEKEKKEYNQKINQEGVWGYVLQVWNPEIDKGWTNLDSCWGFVGWDSGEDIIEEFKEYIDHYIDGTLEVH